MKKSLSFLFIFVLALGLLIGCSSVDTDSSSKSADTDKKTEETEASSFPLDVKDALDNEVTINEEPKKIVSLIPSNTEIAYALGLGDKMVGVSDFDNYPEEVKEVEKIGGMEFNVEKVISLQPDLVLAHESSANNAQEALQQLEESGIAVFVVSDAQSIDASYKAMEQIGTITGTDEKATKIIKDMKQSFADLKEKADAISDSDRKTVFVEVSPAPEIFTSGNNTFMQDLLTVINADNAAAEHDGWVQLDPEAIVALNPDVILTTYGDFEENPVEQIVNRDGWGEVTAVKEGQVYDVNTDIVSRPGPRLVEGAKEIAKVVYPEVFKE